MSDQETPTFFKSPAAFGRWLEKNHARKDMLWVGYHKTHTDKPGMTWAESVDEALCYGWIDGIRKRIDDEAYKIRFTPRRTNSIWSAVNIRNFNTLKKQGRIADAGQRAFDAKKDKHTNRYSFEQGTLKLPKDYLNRLKSNKKAWKFFESLPPSVKKPSVWYVVSAKREETQLRRLEKLIQCCEQGERLPELRR